MRTIMTRGAVAAAMATVASIGLVGVAGSASAAPASAAPASAAPVSAAPVSGTAATPAWSAGCGLAPWEAEVQGRPAFAAGDAGGDYLWHDAAGFHLRVTHRGDDRRVYSGVLTASSPVHLTPVRLEHGDTLRLSADRRSIVFAFVDHGRVDGADFTTDCAADLTVGHLDVGNTALPAARVRLGAGRAHPAAVPFTVIRPA